MMSYLKIERSEDTPEVILNNKMGTIHITGISFPRDIDVFYAPIMGWVEDYVKTSPSYTEIFFKLDYFNTASSRKFLEIMIELEKVLDEGNDVKVRWLYNDEDDDIKSAGVKFSGLTKLTFELEKY